MLKYEIVRDPITGKEWIKTNLRGKALLATYLLNKGTAFTESERLELGLLGKLPAKIETLDEQVKRAYRQFKKYKSNLQRHVYLNNLHDKNEVLFYKLIVDHIVEMIPIIYTPVVGEAVKNYNHEFRQPRGLFIAYPDRDKIDMILENRTHPLISVIVVTDGERVLGIGDQGVGSINIPIAKLMLYTMCGGINPYYTLPIVLDVGTNNQKLLNDPLYLGWRHARIQGKQYDDFIETFVNAVQRKIPGAFLHWEDFGRDNARRILERYQSQICSFNDDMQGTSVVAMAALLSAMNRIGGRLVDQQIIIFGAGTAGVGIADRIVDAMVRLGVTAAQARDKIWLIDRTGLLTKDQSDLKTFHIPYAKPSDAPRDLLALIDFLKPTILIGCSALGRAFNETVVRKMAAHTKRPIIFPLSNPTEQSEADPNDLLKWTEGRALVATGSPFPGGFAQCNNIFAFPGIGLGVIAAKARCLNDNMLWSACQALTRLSTKGMPDRLLPTLQDLRECSHEIAIALVNAAKQENLAGIEDPISAEEAVKAVIWEPYYRPIKPSVPG